MRPTLAARTRPHLPLHPPCMRRILPLWLQRFLAAVLPRLLTTLLHPLWGETSSLACQACLVQVSSAPLGAPGCPVSLSLPVRLLLIVPYLMAPYHTARSGTCPALILVSSRRSQGGIALACHFHPHALMQRILLLLPAVRCVGART